MKTAQEYIETEYGTGHFATVVEMKDAISLFGLMQEYANYLAKTSLRLAADKYDTVEITDHFGSVCDVPNAIMVVAEELPK